MINARDGLKMLGLSVMASFLSGCPKCPEGQTRQVTELLAIGSVESIPLPAGATKCRMLADGASVWEDVHLTANGVSYETTLLAAPTVNDAGQKTYRIATRSMSNWAESRSDLWLDCESAKTLENEVLLRHTDMAKTNVTKQTANVPWMSGTEAVTAFETLRTLRTGQHGVCITNTSPKDVTVKLQYYIPQTACLTEKPTPVWAPMTLQCVKPPPPPPPKTCSGKIHDGSLWAVPTTDPSTACGGLLTVAANTLDEAQGCVRALGGVTPASVCEFEVLLYSDAASVYVYKAAQDGAHAVQCARSTECSACSPTVTQQGNCVSGFKVAR